MALQKIGVLQNFSKILWVSQFWLFHEAVLESRFLLQSKESLGLAESMSLWLFLLHSLELTIQHL